MFVKYDSNEFFDMIMKQIALMQSNCPDLFSQQFTNQNFILHKFYESF